MLNRNNSGKEIDLKADNHLYSTDSSPRVWTISRGRQYIVCLSMTSFFNGVTRLWMDHSCDPNCRQFRVSNYSKGFAPVRSLGIVHDMIPMIEAAFSV